MTKDVDSDILTAKGVGGVFDTKCRKSINLSAKVKSTVCGLAGNSSKSTGISPTSEAVGDVLVLFPFRAVVGIGCSKLISVEYVGYNLCALSNAYTGTHNFVNGNGITGNRSIHSYFDKLCFYKRKVDNDMGAVRIGFAQLQDFLSRGDLFNYSPLPIDKCLDGYMLTHIVCAREPGIEIVDLQLAENEGAGESNYALNHVISGLFGRKSAGRRAEITVGKLAIITVGVTAVLICDSDVCRNKLCTLKNVGCVVFYGACGCVIGADLYDLTFFAIEVDGRYAVDP